MALKNILLVEDESDIRMLGTMGLQDIGPFTVKTAADGSEALEILKGWKPDLIIMDVVMPNLSGTETVKILQQDEHYKKIPVFFLTAKSEDVVFDVTIVFTFPLAIASAILMFAIAAIYSIAPLLAFNAAILSASFFAV